MFHEFDSDRGECSPIQICRMRLMLGTCPRSRRAAASFSGHPSRGSHGLEMGPTMGDISPDHLVQVLFLPLQLGSCGEML